MPTQHREQFETLLIHAGEPRPRIDGAVTTPIFQSSTYEYTRGRDSAVRYIRYNNTPNHTSLHGKMAALEAGEQALVTASGMAAISGTLLGLLSQGDHIVALNTLYGATQSFLADDLPRFGISASFIDGNKPADWNRAVTPATRVLYTESITNPQIRVPDHLALLEFARQHGLVTIIDNTFTSPANFQPLIVGYDLVLHSCSKYLNGHTDIVAGAVIGSNKHVEPICKTLRHLGGTLDPHACFLLNRGIRTLALRVRAHNENALAVARFLAGHKAVSRVNYPGLTDDPGHATARELFKGFGGMLAFEVEGGLPAAEALMGRVNLLTVAPSLGGPETLITSPVNTSHAGQSPEERRAAGIGDGMLRVSVGLEAVEDIVADLEQALGA